jgi:polyisoprenoid-binding protein YceI
VTHLGTARDPRGKEKLGFEGETTVNRKDYGLNWNAALETGGFVVGNEVKGSLSIQAAWRTSQRPRAYDVGPRHSAHQ